MYPKISSKIFDYLVRVHNDKGLEFYWREGTGEWTFISQPNERSHKRASTLLEAAVPPEAFVLKFQFYTLQVFSRPHNSNPLSLWTRTKWSNIFDDLFLHAFFLRQEILHQHVLRHKILHIYFGVLFPLLSKINVQTIVMQKILMQKMLVQNKTTKIFVDLFLQQQLLCQKFLCNNFLSIYFCNGVFCGIYFCIFNLNDYLIKHAKKTFRKLWRNKCSKNFCTCLFIYFCTFN